jgi:hypothetical protein
MEVRGMFGHQPVRVVVVGAEWLDIIEISTGDELASLPLTSGVELVGDVLSVGDRSVRVDRTYLSEAEVLVKLAARSLPSKEVHPGSSTPLFCTQCGSRRDQSAQFCTSCGNSFAQMSERISPSGQRHEPTWSSWGDSANDSEEYFDYEPTTPVTRRALTEVKHRNLVLLAAAVVVLVVVFIVVRESGDSYSESSVEISRTSACATLSEYAFVGIPATYIDDGAQLLYALANDFRSFDRGDIASLVEEVVDLTYGGPTGQLQAKNLLLDTASTYC